MIELKAYQKLPIEFMKDHRGLLLYHQTGAGKTLTALFSMYQFPNDIIIIGTKSSKKTFVDNIKKSKMDPGRFTFYTYAKIKILLQDNIKIFKDKSVIIDEVHNLRTETANNLYITSSIVLAFKIILLSATPVINYPNDLSVLVNMVRGEDVLPTEHYLFDQMFFDDEKMELINEDILFNKIKNTVSYYKMVDDENYPRSTTHSMEVQMNHEQLDEYVYFVKKIIFEDENLTNTINILDIDYGLLPGKKKNNFLSATRQLSNTLNHSENSPKMKAIFEKIQEGPYPIVVYSNFLENGIYTLAIVLEKNNISYKAITGETTQDKLNVIVNNYNDGAYKVLLISSAGSESLDLKNTRQIHIMEHHWNFSKLNQVIGRVIRYKSHSLLPKKQRHVDIYYWISVFPPHIKNASADQYLMEISRKKQIIWDKFQDIIIEASIENNYAKEKKNNSKKNNSKKTGTNYYKKYLKYKFKYDNLRKELQ